MTLPHERIRALDQARILLYALLNPQQTPRVPSNVRRWARRVVKHFPMGFELEQLARGKAEQFLCPDFREQPLPPLGPSLDGSPLGE